MAIPTPTETAVTCFVHIPKTAGSTVAEIIRKAHKPGCVVELPPQSQMDAESVIRGLDPKTQAICGHVRYGLHVFSARPFRYFTFLRDPVETALSLYHYISRTPAHSLHRKVVQGELDVLDCARIVQNRQIHYVAGIVPGETPPLSWALERAKETLERHFAVFGLVERFDESVVLISRVLGWNVRSYRAMNVTSRRPGQDALTPAQLDQLKEISAGDSALYRFAEDLFERRLQEIGTGFTRDVRRLRFNTALRSRIRNAIALIPLSRSKR